MEGGRKAEGSMYVVSAALSPNQITETWSVKNASTKATVKAPKLQVRVCSSVTESGQCIDQEQQQVLDNSQEVHDLVVEGLDDDPFGMMGVYKLVEGRIVNERGVWQQVWQQGRDEQKERFLYCGGNNCWVVSTRYIKDMKADPQTNSPRQRSKFEGESEMKDRSYKKADKVAKQVLKSAEARKEDICVNEVLTCLQSMPFMENRLRRNVIPAGLKSVYSQCAGMTKGTQKGQPPTVSRVAGKCPNVVKVLALFMRQAEAQANKSSLHGETNLDKTNHAGHETNVTGMSFLHGDFSFTSITLNYNYAAKPHRDSSHVDGLARIIALGDFTGGELHVEGKGALSVKNRWVDFDGRLLHSVAPFEGERYSLVFFANEAALDRSMYQEPFPKIRQDLEAIGMRWPAERLLQSRSGVVPDAATSRRTTAKGAAEHVQWTERALALSAGVVALLLVVALASRRSGIAGWSTTK
jgi:hypothetical protein